MSTVTSTTRYKTHRFPIEIISHAVWLYCLWRAVEQEGKGLDILVQRRRDKRAAQKFFRKLLNGLTYVPRVRPHRHRLSARVYHQELGKRFQIWQEITTRALAA